MAEKLLTVAETADRLRCSAWLVREQIAGGDLPAVRIGRLVRIRPEALLEWQLAQEQAHRADLQR